MEKAYIVFRILIHEHKGVKHFSKVSLRVFILHLVLISSLNEINTISSVILRLRIPKYMTAVLNHDPWLF